MAAPGYPQMGQMPPMGGPPMGGPPMGGGMPPASRPMRRGTSKVVPVVVSAGLAIGVFCGLLFGLGTGKHEADAQPAAGSNTKTGSDTGETPAPTPDKGNLLDPSKTPAAGSAAQAGSGSGSAVAAAGSAAGSGSAAVKPPGPPTVKLTIQIKPEAAAKVAKIEVNGKEITGTSIDLPVDTKVAKVSVTATGYHSASSAVDMAGGDTTIEVELPRRASSGTPASGSPQVPKRPPGPKKPPGGNLIDI